MTWGHLRAVKQTGKSPNCQVREKTAIGVLTRLNSSGELLQDFQAENYMLESAVQTTTPAALQTTDPSVVTGHGLVQRLLKFSGSMNHSLNQILIRLSTHKLFLAYNRRPHERSSIGVVGPSEHVILTQNILQRTPPTNKVLAQHWTF